MVLIEVVIFIFTLALIALYSEWKYTYWKRKNLPYIKPRFPFGNMENPWTRKHNLGVWLQMLYNHFKEQGQKHAGFYMFLRPVYLPIDPDILKNIMLKGFDHFDHRGWYYNEKDDPLSAHLFALEGQKWRDLRGKLTPVFSPGKMKSMFSTLTACMKGMQEYVSAKCDNAEALHIKNVLDRFSINVIGSCAFGIECNSYKSENAEFPKYGIEVFKPKSKLVSVKAMFADAKPELARRLGVLALPKPLTSFFLKVVKETVYYRETNNSRRNDMLQTLIDMKVNNELVLSIEEIAAQALVFFLAGFETTSSTMTFCLYALAENIDMQEKVRNEIRSVLAKHGNEVTYDAISDMKYMQQVIDEALRKYPPAYVITRECVKDYQIPNTDIVIEKGTMVMIPLLALQNDPDHFPNPEKFDPERFSETNKHNHRPFTYLPFGEGPRICIGVRFGMMEAKVGLTTLLKDFKFSINEKTQVPIVWDQFSISLGSKLPIWLNIEKAE